MWKTIATIMVLFTMILAVLYFKYRERILGIISVVGLVISALSLLFSVVTLQSSNEYREEERKVDDEASYKQTENSENDKNTEKQELLETDIDTKAKENEVTEIDRSQAYLLNIDYVTSSNQSGEAFRYYDTVKDNLGYLYGNGIGGNTQGENWQEYKLSGKYKELIGRVVLNYDYRSQIADDTIIKLYGDDELLYVSPIMTAGQEPEDFIINVTGVDILKVSIVGENMLRLVDCILYDTEGNDKKDYKKNVENKSKIYLQNMDYVTSSNEIGSGFRYYDTVKDNVGITYGNGIGGNTQGENWQEYKLDGIYKEIHGRVILNYEYRSQLADDVLLKIYGDDIPLYVSPLIEAGQEPVNFCLDITGVDILKVSIVGENMLRLVDCVLYDTQGNAEKLYEINSLVNNEKIYLRSLDYFISSNPNGKAFVLYNSVKDNQNNMYVDALGGIGTEENWEEYRLYGNYKCISGKIILNYEYRERESNETYVNIYGDSNILYTSPLITAGQEPVDFSIDIEGVDRLRVSIEGSNMIRVVDCLLTK